MALRLTEKQAKVLGFVPPDSPTTVEAPIKVVVRDLTAFGFIMAGLGGWLVGFICGLMFSQHM